MKISWFIRFGFRVFVGIGIVLLVNQILANSNLIVSVPINIFSVLTAGILGLPGVAMLYGMAFYLLL